MARQSSGRTGREATRSGSDLLAPLPTDERPEATAPADMRLLVETIEELKALVATPPRPSAAGAADFRQAAESVAAAIEALRTDLGQAEERQAGIVSEIRETQTAILKGIGDLAAALEEGGAMRGALEASDRALRDSREAAERLTRSGDSVAREVARLGDTLDRADASGNGLPALDAWRDDFIRHVNDFLTSAGKEAGVPAAETRTLEATALAHVDRITARLSLVESEVGKATATMGEALGTVTTSLTDHGESMRRAEASNLRTRQQVGFLRDDFDSLEREHRLWRRAWVAPLLSLLAIIAAMVLEGYTHWINGLLRFLLSPG